MGEVIKVQPLVVTNSGCPLSRSNGVVEVEPVDEEGNPHRGNRKEKTPGPWPRGTRETAVFGGDCLSRIPFVRTEGKPKVNDSSGSVRCPGSGASPQSFLYFSKGEKEILLSLLKVQ